MTPFTGAHTQLKSFSRLRFYWPPPESSFRTIPFYPLRGGLKGRAEEGPNRGEFVGPLYTTVPPNLDFPQGKPIHTTTTTTILLLYH